eukprot:PITA_21213
MRAWGQKLNVGDKILLLANGNQEFPKALGVTLDLSDKHVGLGVRSSRYALLAEDGVIKVLNLEEGGAFTMTGRQRGELISERNALRRKNTCVHKILKDQRLSFSHGSHLPPKFSPDTILLVVSNPVDILTYIAWKLSGLPSNKVMGNGTNLDSSRFRSMIADHLDVNAQEVQAYIVGEHGDSSVALWSSISVGGVPVLSFLDKQEIPYEKEHLEAIHQAVVNSAYERRVHPVSVMAKDFHSIEEEVFLSLPAQLGRGGILGVASIHLTEEETHCLKMSADAIFEVQKHLHI